MSVDSDTVIYGYNGLNADPDEVVVSLQITKHIHYYILLKKKKLIWFHLKTGILLSHNQMIYRYKLLIKDLSLLMTHSKG